MKALILAIALEAGIDGRLALSLAVTENAALQADKIGVTGDLGIMQLNASFLSYFVGRYWDKPGVFDWKNPEHNIYVGLCHLKYLLAIPEFNTWQAVMAYNCGENAVRSGKPPDSSIEYANKVYTGFIGGGSVCAPR